MSRFIQLKNLASHNFSFYPDQFQRWNYSSIDSAFQNIRTKQLFSAKGFSSCLPSMKTGGQLFLNSKLSLRNASVSAFDLCCVVLPWGHAMFLYDHSCMTSQVILTRSSKLWAYILYMLGAVHLSGYVLGAHNDISHPDVPHQSCSPQL